MSELQNLFTEISKRQNACAMQCEKRNGCDSSCCSLATMGGEPSVTVDELRLINDHLKTLDDFTFYEAGESACKFLDADGRCKIYPVRPIDCRIHFCGSEGMESQSNKNLDNLLGDYHERHETAFYNAMLIDACTFHLE